MRWFWTTAIKPLLAAARPASIVEIGADAGATSVPLLEFAGEHDATVHVIDPAPAFDENALKERFDDRLRLHRKKSLDVLPEMGAADAVLIDGDHNWYTVYHELEALRTAAAKAGRSFPLTFMHDVSWPYARRDMYYDPETIPARWRHPWARRPIVWGRRELGDEEGVNGEFANACMEGGARNGVLTALEDFRDGSGLDLELCLIEGMAGLAILVPPSRLEASPPLRAEWRRLQSPQFLRSHIGRLAALLAARADWSGAKRAPPGELR